METPVQMALVLISGVGSLLAMVVSLVSIANFVRQQRKAAEADGMKQQQFQQMKEDVQKAFDKIHRLEAETRTSEKSLVEIVTKLDGIEKMLDKLSEKLDRHCDERE